MEIVIGHMDLDRAALAGLEWSLNEITDNVLVHAEAPLGGLVQVSTFTEAKRIMFVVADAGRGVLSSMREGHPEIADASSAIAEAVKQGVTGGRGQGNGLAGTLQIATVTCGSFRITSDRAQLNVYRPPAEAQYVHHSYSRPPARTLNGTAVVAELGTEVPVHRVKRWTTRGSGMASGTSLTRSTPLQQVMR